MQAHSIPAVFNARYQLQNVIILVNKSGAVLGNIGIEAENKLQ